MSTTEPNVASSGEWGREKTAPFEALGNASTEAEIGEERVEDTTPVARRFEDLLGRLEAISAQSKLAKAIVRGADGSVVTFAVSEAGIVSSPRSAGARYEDEPFINERVCCDEDDALARMFVRLLRGCVALEFEPWNTSFIDDVVRLDPCSLVRHSIEGEPGDPVWKMRKRLGAHESSWWLWRCTEGDFVLADCSNEHALSLARETLAGVAPLVRAVRHDAPMNSVLMNAPTASWNLCWSPGWLLVHQAVSVGHVICAYDASTS